MCDHKCYNCIDFTSYQDYYEDDLEPDDCGFCKFEGLKHADGEGTCESFDSRYKI